MIGVRVLALFSLALVAVWGCSADAPSTDDVRTPLGEDTAIAPATASSPVPCGENTPDYWCGATGGGCSDWYRNPTTGNMSATNRLTGERYVWNYINGDCWFSVAK